MRLGIKAKQVLGVTSIVGLVVVALSAIQLSSLARMNLEGSQARGELLANTIFQRARSVVAQGGDPYAALHDDSSIRSLLESTIAFSPNVTYAAIVDTTGRIVADSDETLDGQILPPEPELSTLLAGSGFGQLQAIYEGHGRTLEITQSLLRNNTNFGSIRIGVSTLLIREDLNTALRPFVVTAGAALLIAMLVSMLLAQLLLRPIHVIRSGLSRLQQGEVGVTLDLKQQDEFGDLGTFFNAVSAQLAADRTRLAADARPADEPERDRLEDAVALVGPDDELLFANGAMLAILPESPVGRRFRELLPEDHPYRTIVEQTLEGRESQGPRSVLLGEDGGASEGEGGEWLAGTQVVHDHEGRIIGAMLLARNVGYLSQVQSTITYSRKLAALGRLSAGVAHEVKNPLNAMMIHLELLRQALSGEPGRRRHAEAAAVAGGAAVSVPATEPRIDQAAALQHVSTIADEIRRLDQVVQGFLKFTRPQEVRLEPVSLHELFEELKPTIEPEAERTGVTLVIDCPPGIPDVSGDPGLLHQVFLNLALNACQAMPQGGTLRIVCTPVRGQRISILVEDTGIGIPPDRLEKIFELYFTTKERGSGIGLSMVYRIVQLHDGDIEVQSTPGRGTTFRVQLPRADTPRKWLT
jgi:signal transduction histidine kinase